MPDFTHKAICNVHCRAAGAKGTGRSSSRHHPPESKASVGSRDVPHTHKHMRMHIHMHMPHAHAHAHAYLASRVVSVASVEPRPPPLVITPVRAEPPLPVGVRRRRRRAGRRRRKGRAPCYNTRSKIIPEIIAIVPAAVVSRRSSGA